MKHEIVPYKQLFLVSSFYLNTESQTLPHHGTKISLEASPKVCMTVRFTVCLDVQYLNGLLSTMEAGTDHISPWCHHLSLTSLPSLPGNSHLPVKSLLKCHLLCIQPVLYLTAQSEFLLFGGFPITVHVSLYNTLILTH